MVRADAEAADGDEVFCFGKDAGGELGFRTDAEDIDVPGEDRFSVGFAEGRNGAINTEFSR